MSILDNLPRDYFDTWEDTQAQYPGGKPARTFNMVPIPSEENLMMGDINPTYNLESINTPSRMSLAYTKHIDENALLEQALHDNLITEDQYKRMGGFNVLQNAPKYGPIRADAGDVGLASFAYNTAKTLWDPDERGYGKYGYLDSIKKNYQGAKEGLQGKELELYQTILSGNADSLSPLKDDFTFEQQEDGSFIKRYHSADDKQFPDTVYDKLGEYANRKIPGLNVQHPQDYDKATYLGIDNIDPRHLNIDTMHWDEKDRQNAIHNNALNVMKQGYEGPSWLEKHNAAQRAYNDTTGLNTNYYEGSLQGNIDNAARVGRRNQARIDNVLGDFISGKSKMSMQGRHDLVGFLGTNKQKQTYLHELGKQTGKNLDGSQWSNPYVDESTYTDLVGKTDPYGNTITRDTINQDVTGMYTDDPSGIGDIGDAPSSASVDDSWGDVDGVSYIARGGMVKDAPRYRYAEGGIVNLLPKGAW
jgi:hypothetical protein